MKTLLLTSRMVENCEENRQDHSLALKVEKCIIKRFCGFICYLMRICPATAGPSPLYHIDRMLEFEFKDPISQHAFNP